jgi:hypothetical protein
MMALAASFAVLFSFMLQEEGDDQASTILSKYPRRAAQEL